MRLDEKKKKKIQVKMKLFLVIFFFATKKYSPNMRKLLYLRQKKILCFAVKKIFFGIKDLIFI